MTDYSKLVKALRRCASIDWCDGMCEMNYGSTGCESSLEMDAADAIEALQATVSKLEERTKAQQERLEDYMEKQLIIDRWGAKWMTSAKDVPTAAYKHGYADGRDEAMAKMEVQE